MVNIKEDYFATFTPSELEERAKAKARRDFKKFGQRINKYSNRLQRIAYDAEYLLQCQNNKAR